MKKRKRKTWKKFVILPSRALDLDQELACGRWPPPAAGWPPIADPYWPPPFCRYTFQWPATKLGKFNYSRRNSELLWGPRPDGRPPFNVLPAPQRSPTPTRKIVNFQNLINLIEKKNLEKFKFSTSGSACPQTMSRTPGTHKPTDFCSHHWVARLLNSDHYTVN